MLLRLLLLFTLVPIIELFLILHVAKLVGSAWTFGIIIVTGVVGSTLARAQGIAVIRATQEELARGQLPSQGLLDGGIILCGGALLLTPGFLTDVLGLSCLVPWTRHALRLQIRKRLEKWVESGVVVNVRGPGL